MNVLILNGSPRRHGNVSAMLDAIREEAERNGASVTTVFVPELQVKPCTGWVACRKTPRRGIPQNPSVRIARRRSPAGTLRHQPLRCAGSRSPLLLG